MEAGAQAYLTKPADPEALIDRINYLIGQSPVKIEQKDLTGVAGLVLSAQVAAALIDEKRTYKAVSPWLMRPRAATRRVI